MIFLNNFVVSKLSDYLKDHEVEVEVVMKKRMKIKSLDELQKLDEDKDILSIRFVNVEIPVSIEEIKQLINEIINKQYYIKLRVSTIRRLFGDELAELVESNKFS